MGPFLFFLVLRFRGFSRCYPSREEEARNILSTVEPTADGRAGPQPPASGTSGGLAPPMSYVHRRLHYGYGRRPKRGLWDPAGYLGVALSCLQTSSPPEFVVGRATRDWPTLSRSGIWLREIFTLTCRPVGRPVGLLQLDPGIECVEGSRGGGSVGDDVHLGRWASELGEMVTGEGRR